MIQIKLIDISQTLNDSMVHYPGLKKFELSWRRDYRNGDMSLSEFSMANHVGTHIDSPYHFIVDGKKIRDLNLNRFYGLAQVIEIPPEQDSITVNLLKKYNLYSERILFKTVNSKHYLENDFKEDYVYISAKAAQYLAEQPIKLVGFDCFSIDKYKSETKVSHKILLSNNIIILEGINLNGVKQGDYQLICFPLKMDESEAAPCRAILVDNTN